jgi:hypothetical protein
MDWCECHALISSYKRFATNSHTKHARHFGR